MYDPTVREYSPTDDLCTVRKFAVQDPLTGVTNVADHRVYDSHGNLKSRTNAGVHCLPGFTDLAVEETTGMQSNLNRWYDAKVGRWLDEDPLGLEAGDANTDVYCGNDPVNGTDPTGLWGTNVHVELTMTLASMAGFRFADKLAQYTNEPDSWAAGTNPFALFFQGLGINIATLGDKFKTKWGDRAKDDQRLRACNKMSF